MRRGTERTRRRRNAAAAGAALAIVGAVVVGTGILAAAEPERPLPVAPSRPIEIRGEVVAFECYLRDGARGEGHRTCALQCRKNGGSLAIVEDQTGDLYPVAGREAASDPGAAVADLIGARVAARGQLYERSGARLLVVEEAARLR